MSHRRLAFTAPLICLALAGCGSTKIFTVTKTTTTARPSTGTTRTVSRHAVDTTHLERAITSSAEAQRHVKATVVCPAKISVPTGGSFYCAAQSVGEVTPFLVTEHAGGRLTYKGVPATRAPSVDMPEIEIAIAQKARANHVKVRSVSCPQEMPLQQGLRFVCAVTTGPGKPTSFVVTELNDFGRVSFASV